MTNESMWSEQELADIVICADERGITPRELIRRAVLDDLAR